MRDRVKTFIYTEQEKVVAGTDGEKTYHRVFGREARVVTVLYRAGWGETRWTRIEETAIRNRGHEHGYDFTVFVPLETPPKVPEWVPAARIWLDLKRFNLDRTAGAIEARVQDSGGQIHQETVGERAQRVERAIKFEKRRDKFRWEEGVQAANSELAKLLPVLQAHADVVRKETSIPLAASRAGIAIYITGLGRALGIVWTQKYWNALRDALLEVFLLSSVPRQFPFEGPKSIQSMRFTFDLLPSEVGGWISSDGQHQFSTDLLAEYLTNYYLEHGRNPA